MPAAPPESGPLAGIRVVDLSRLLPGAFATQMLAELGAEVLKVEDPAGGDPMRHLPPVLDGRGIYDLLLNRGKKSVALDLKEPADAEVLDRLVSTADVVVESFRPRTARRLGVDAAQLRAKYPRLVHCSITGYGQTGPYADRPGHDLNYVALSGLLAADRPNPTELPHMFIADVGGGAMTSVIGILAALYGRTRHGEGASLDISMHDAMLYWVMLPAARDLVDGGAQAEGELPTFGAHASYNVYRTADGLLVALGALEQKFWVAFCAGIGRPDLAARHGTGESDQFDLIKEMRALFATRTRAEWLSLMATHDVCLTPVNSPREALRDPHVVARRVVQPVSGMQVVRPPFLTRIPDLSPPPSVGQHTREVIAGLPDLRG
jgi:crotonobetainyl-CoA:carnitine CoA-transferase CaiB-like acyl-CoA transferase